MNIQDKINEALFPIVVRASAGTGKTYSLVEKVNHLVKTGVNPVNILVFTFTLDAANELKSRIQDGAQMTVGTIHSVMLQIIREHHPKRYNVLDNGKQLKFIFDIFKEQRIEFDNYHNYTSKISMAKNIFTDYQELLDKNPDVILEFFNDERLYDFAVEYERKKEQYHKIDFDDMALKAFDLLDKNHNILDNRQERWKYIFVDEAQDLCQPQIDIIKLLAEKYKNLFIVGDEKQAIYGSFRASTPEFIKNFKQYYPNCNEFVLPTTYRCAQNICDAGNMVARLIDGSCINTVNNNAGLVEIVDLFDTQSQEAFEISRRAIELFKSTNKSIKILYRTNAQSLGFQMSMVRNNIPFSINQTNSVFSSKEYKIATGMCQYFYEYENRSVASQTDILKIIRPILENRSYMYQLIKKMNDYSLPIDKIRDPNLYPIIDELKAIKSFMNNKIHKPADIFEFTAQMVGSRYFSDSAYDNLIGISEFIKDCKTLSDVFALVEEINKPRTVSKTERVISLSTIHGSKGLEADIVFLTGVADNIFPHKMGISAEEMNLFYVGVTRAREELYVSGFYLFGEREFTSHSYLYLIK